MTTKVKAHVHYDIELTDLEFEPDVTEFVLAAVQGVTDKDKVLERYFMDEWHTEVIAKVIARHNYGISVGTLWFGEETQTGGYNVVVARRLNGKPEIRRYGSVAYRVKNTLTCFGEGCQR